MTPSTLYCLTPLSSVYIYTRTVAVCGCGYTDMNSNARARLLGPFTCSMMFFTVLFLTWSFVSLGQKPELTEECYPKGT